MFHNLGRYITPLASSAVCRSPFSHKYPLNTIFSAGPCIMDDFAGRVEKIIFIGRTHLNLAPGSKLACAHKSWPGRLQYDKSAPPL